MEVDVKLLRRIALICKITLFVLIGLLVVLELIGYNVSLADTATTVGPGQPTMTLWDWVVRLGDTVKVLVGTLALVMVIIAGVVYAFDLGGGKQIGVAKEMIISAISGLILFMLASWLLGEVTSLFPPPVYDNSPNAGSPSSNALPSPPGDNDGSSSRDDGTDDGFGPSVFPPGSEF